MAEDKEDVAVGLKPRATGKHVAKRALRNKALSISFNEKDLMDYVGGFHKRKKKRRKEAQQQIQEKDRLRRIELRKKRKLDREYVQFGDVKPANDDDEPDGSGDELEQDEETDPIAQVAGMKTYENGETTITVTTSEILREGDDKSTEKTGLTPKSSETYKKRSIPVEKKKPKTGGGNGGKRRSGGKPQKKRDKRMGKVKKSR